MGCKLVDLATLDPCPESDGGIYETQIAECEDIADVIFDADGCITNFVMVSLGNWYVYTMDDDDTAFYNQEGERTNNKHTVNQTSFFKFAGVSKTAISFANGIKGCCCLVAVHFFNSGIAVVQGIDYNEDTGTWLVTKKKTKATVNILSDTGDNEDRVEVNLISTGRCFSAVTALTSEDLQAL